MSRSLRRAWVAPTCLLTALGCSPARRGGELPSPPNRVESTIDATPADAASPRAGDAARGASSDRAGARDEGWLVIDAPSVLTELESSGVSLRAMLGGAPGPLDNGALIALPRYASLVRVVEADIRETARADPSAGVSVARSSHRLFDVRWLRSPAARFELVGVVNRLDRAGIIGGCGEVRLIYRLAYTTEVKGSVIASRLPMTLSLEMSALPAAGFGAPCGIAPLRWFPPRGEREGPALARSSSPRKARFSKRSAIPRPSVGWP